MPLGSGVTYRFDIFGSIRMLTAVICRGDLVGKFGAFVMGFLLVLSRAMPWNFQGWGQGNYVRKLRRLNGCWAMPHVDFQLFLYHEYQSTSKSCPCKAVHHRYPTVRRRRPQAS